MKERAYILPSTLFLLSLILVALIPSYESVVFLIRSQSDESLSRKASVRAGNDVITEGFHHMPDNYGKELHKCFRSTAKENRILVMKSFCGSFHKVTPNLLKLPLLDSNVVGGTQNLPSLDFASFFKNSKYCEAQGWQNISIVPFSKSSGSAVSSQYCAVKTAHILEVSSITANVVFNSQVDFAKETSLAARGFIFADSQLKLDSGRISLVAGGDLVLKEVSSILPVELTLISATGNVKIAKILGPIVVRAYAKQRVSIPYNTQLSTRGFAENALDFLSLSIY
jgi:hypothetical protein